MAKTHLKIEGMTCQHCVSHVTEALEAVPGVTSAKVNLKKGEAVVKSEDTSLEQLSAAVSSAGYQVV
ncbi:CopZ family metallochaperone [Pseudolactococcus reticulitermitis]|nr:cation transporter [Lactococcus reticulitermitis]